MNVPECRSVLGWVLVVVAVAEDGGVGNVHVVYDHCVHGYRVDDRDHIRGCPVCHGIDDIVVLPQ